MSCQVCDDAATNPRTGIYMAGCMSCEARMLAQGPAAHKALGGDPGPLRDAMRAIWPTDEQYMAGEVAVHGWITRLNESAA